MLTNTSCPVDILNYADLDGSYKSLCKTYHPDMGGSTDQFLLLQQLYKRAQDEIASGIAIGTATVFIGTKTIPYRAKYSQGEVSVFVGTDTLLYVGEPIRAFNTKFTFQSTNIRDQIAPLLPTGTVELTKKGVPYILIPKRKTEYLLAEVITHKMPIETSVWMLNRLYNIGCYMSIHKTLNMNLSPYTVCVDLESHSASLYGGWEYCYKTDQKMVSLPLSTYNLMSETMKFHKIATEGLILSQIRNTILDCVLHGNIPKVYKNWLTYPAKDDILQEYSEWEKNILPKLFPVRKFFKWSI